MSGNMCHKSDQGGVRRDTLTKMFACRTPSMVVGLIAFWKENYFSSPFGSCRRVLFLFDMWASWKKTFIVLHLTTPLEKIEVVTNQS